MFSGLLSHSAAPAADFSRLQRASITFRDVAKRYGDHQVLNAINLQVEPGEVVAILGPSGSGKSTLIRLINQLESLSGGEILLDGKRSTAESIVYGAFDIVEAKTGEDPLSVFKKAMDNVRPTVEVKPRRVGGATYQVPTEVNSRRATTLAIRWIVGYSRDRKERSMAERLANEIMDASNGLGASVKKREDVYKMAESNRAFSHYRW